MAGRIYITRHGYDPQKGGYIKDPYLDGRPTMGACRPDLRRSLRVGDTVFAVSGGIPGFKQFILGCFDIQEKITMQEAYKRFPEQRLHLRDDGQKAGNVICDAKGHQHPLDDHKNFENRLQNYIIGGNEILLQTDEEIEVGRRETMDILRDVFHKAGSRPFDILGRSARKLDIKQVDELKDWLASIKQGGR